MYFDDLSTYSYHIKEPMQNVLNIGWLNERFPYKKGNVSEEFKEKLIRLFLSDGVFNPEVGLIRGGNHCCELCGAKPTRLERDGREKVLGASEIWIGGKDAVFYAAPSMIIHYVLEHQYCPPVEYIDAVMTANLNAPFTAQEVWLNGVLGQP